MNVVIFAPKCIDTRYLVDASPPTVIMPIPLKLYRSLVHGLKMCILFGYNPQIIFVTFFTKLT